MTTTPKPFAAASNLEDQLVIAQRILGGRGSRDDLIRLCSLVEEFTSGTDVISLEKAVTALEYSVRVSDTLRSELDVMAVEVDRLRQERAVLRAERVSVVEQLAASSAALRQCTEELRLAREAQDELRSKLERS